MNGLIDLPAFRFISFDSFFLVPWFCVHYSCASNVEYEYVMVFLLIAGDQSFKDSPSIKTACVSSVFEALPFSHIYHKKC